VLELLRQRRWLGFSIFVLVMLALCVVLARWQWNRYEQRQVENANLDAALAAPIAAVDTLLTATGQDPDAAPLPEELRWRSVSATGTFDTQGQVAVRRRPLDGRNGFWIVTPLRTDSGVLLVNRGWIAAPSGDAASTPTVPAPPSGEVTVSGRLRPAEPTPTTDPAPPGQAWAADPQVLITPAGVPRYNAYLELHESTPPAAEGLTALDEQPGHKGLNNLVYSGQWLIFALVGLFGWWRLMSQEARREQDDADSALGQPQA
jgi:cytochrome oxidase assembly protein ShyY1